MSINSKTKAAVDTLLTDNTTTELEFQTGLQDVTTELDLAQSKLTGATPITGVDINSGNIDGTTIGAVTPSPATFSTLDVNTTITFAGATVSDLGTVTTANIDGGTIDGTTIGATTPSVATFSSATVNGNLTVDTNTFAVNSTSNRVGVLTTSPAVSLDASSATDAIGMPVGTTAQRPGTPATGMFRYNSTNATFEGYDGSSWGGVGGASGGGGNPFIYENDTNVSVDYSVTSGKNGMSAGPITVNSGVTVTIPTGSVWTIV